MIKKIIIDKLLKIILLLYIFILPKKSKLGDLKNLNFTKVDFTNYRKIKLLIFNDNFIRNENEPNVFNFDFLNYAINIGGKRGIEIARKNIIKWQKINGYKINKLWNSDIIAKRIINLIYNFEYINSISAEKDERKLQKIIYFNVRRLNFDLYFKRDEDFSILELKTYLLIKLLTRLLLIIGCKKYFLFLYLKKMKIL